MRRVGLREEGRVKKTRHHLIGRAPCLTARGQVVQRAVNKTQTVWQQGVLHQFGQRSTRHVLFSDTDLVEDVLKVVCVHENHWVSLLESNVWTTHRVAGGIFLTQF